MISRPREACGAAAEEEAKVKAHRKEIKANVVVAGGVRRVA